jgi:putative PIN family toxin of toxin-antitoxin system
VRAVLDTNVIVSAVLKADGIPRQLIELQQDGAFELILSPQLLGEVNRVLDRPKFRDALGMSVADVMAELRSIGDLYLDHPIEHHVLPEDPDDVYLLDLAVTTTSVLVTGDRGLLRLADRAPVLKPRAFFELLVPPMREQFKNQLPERSLEQRFEVARRQSLAYAEEVFST